MSAAHARGLCEERARTLQYRGFSAEFPKAIGHGILGLVTRLHPVARLREDRPERVSCNSLSELDPYRLRLRVLIVRHQRLVLTAKAGFLVATERHSHITL